MNVRTPLILAVGVVLGAAATLAGLWAAPIFARAHFIVQQADQVRREMADPTTPRTLQSDAFRLHERNADDLFAEAAAIERRFRVATPILFAWCVVVLAFFYVGVNRDRRREIYEIDYATCLACGRCFWSCPMEKCRRAGVQTPAKAAETPGATP